MSFRQQEPVVPGMLHEPAPGLHQPLLETRERPAFDPRCAVASSMSARSSRSGSRRTARGRVSLSTPSTRRSGSSCRPLPVIRSSRHRVSRAPSWCSGSCTPTSPRLSGTPVPSLASLSPGWPCSGGTSSPPCFACWSPMRRTTSVSQHVIVLGCYDSAVACPRSRARAERPFVAVSAPSAIDEHGDSPASSRRRRCRTRRRPWPRRWDARSGRRVTPPGKRLEPACS